MLADITWRPGIGDRNPFAWCVTVVYFLACWLCLSAGSVNRTASRHSGKSSPWWSWYVFAGMVLLLGMNKQLDLQVLLTQIGREVARHQGWYSQRRPVQAAFILAGTLMGMACAAIGYFVLRQHWRQVGVAYLGVICLTTFVLIRAASMHHIDVLLYRLPWVGNWMNLGWELGGAVLVACGAFMAGRGTSARDAAIRRSQGALG